MLCYYYFNAIKSQPSGLAKWLTSVCVHYLKNETYLKDERIWLDNRRKS